MAFRTEKKFVPPWGYLFLTDETVPCLFCQQKDRPQIVRAPEEDVEETRPPIAGVCEACSVHVYHLWRRSKGEVPPGFDAEAACKVSLVKVFVPKLRLSSQTESGKEFPGLIDSYDILLTKHGETVDLPGVEVVGAETEVDAAVRALKEVGIATWKQFIEPLWTGFTPRGRLASVLLVSAWTKKEGTPDKSINWKKWPVHDHVPDGLKGFYMGLVSAWQLRLFKYQAILPAQRTEEISVYLREGATKYINVQQELRVERINRERGFPVEQKERDLSMIEYARKSMSDDERKIERAIETYELGEAEVARQEAEKAGDLGIEGVEKENRHEGEDSQGATGTNDGGDPRRNFTPGLRASSKVVVESGGTAESNGWDAGILARVRSEVGVEPPSSGETSSSSEDDEGEGEGEGEDADEPVGADPGAGGEGDEDPASGVDSGPEPGFARKGRPLTTERK